MKKATEYADQYKANPTIQTLTEIIKQMVFEIKEIGEMRHAKSDESFLSIFNEQQKKWQAFISLVGDSNIRPDGFDRFCQKYLPEVYADIQRIKNLSKTQSF